MYVKKNLILSDDLTGCFDSAAHFASRGLQTNIFTGKDAIQAAQQEIQKNNTMTILNMQWRYDPPVRISEKILKIKHLINRVALIKVDSTCRGSISELVTCLTSLNLAPVVSLCTPWHGRVVRDGRLLVEGNPIEKTQFVSDPKIGFEIRAKENLEFLQHKGLLLDATTFDHLLQQANDYQDTNLLMGASGLAAAVSEISTGIALSSEISISKPEDTFFLCGSKMDIAKLQIEAISALVPNSNVLSGKDFSLENNTLEQFSALALERFVQADCTRLVIIGGETAEIFFETVGVGRIRCLGINKQMLPVMEFEYAGDNFEFLAKGGGTGPKNVFTALVK